MRPKGLGSQIISLIEAGVRYADIAEQLNIARSTVTYYSRVKLKKSPKQGAVGRKWSPEERLVRKERWESRSSEQQEAQTKSMQLASATRHQRRLLNAPFNTLGWVLKRRRIFMEQNGKCLCCGLEPRWNGQVLVFALDHISGNKKDNSRENLRLICPNCHSQTPTYTSKNASPDGRRRMGIKRGRTGANGTTRETQNFADLGSNPRCDTIKTGAQL
jgi:hypothetical protein